MDPQGGLGLVPCRAGQAGTPLKTVSTLRTNKLTLFTIGNIYIYRFLKCQFYFSYIGKKIANIRNYRRNDEYFPHSEQC